MAADKRKGPDRIGIPEPGTEPRPPRIESAGALGEVGERKEKDEKEAIWRDRPATPDEDPRDPAARKPAPR
jgi:hypothetical protein